MRFCRIRLKNKFLWSSFQLRLASVMNLKFRGRKISQPFSDPRNQRKFCPSKILGYTVLRVQYHATYNYYAVFVGQRATCPRFTVIESQVREGAEGTCTCSAIVIKYDKMLCKLYYFRKWHRWSLSWLS